MSTYRELPGWAEDRIYNDVHVHIGWVDRLRVLFQGELIVDVRNTVEHAPGRIETETGVRLPHRCWPWHKHLGYDAQAPSE